MVHSSSLVRGQRPRSDLLSVVIVAHGIIATLLVLTGLLLSMAIVDLLPLEQPTFGERALPALEGVLPFGPRLVVAGIAIGVAALALRRGARWWPVPDVVGAVLVAMPWILAA